MAQVAFERVSKVYPDGTRAVNDINLQIADGEFMVLVGPSGCGKTTALRMVAGLEDITRGVLKIGDRVVNHVPSRDRDIAMVFQSYALYPHLSVYENIAFGLKIKKVPKAEIQRRVADALTLVGLAGFADRYPRRMSGGQQQRVALARALVIKPDVLLLDEPLSNLDAKLREEMQVELRQIQRTVGTTTILVTHDQGEAMALSDRIVVMNRGRAEQIARPTEIYQRPASAFVANFLGRINVLPASVAAGTATIGGARFTAPGSPDGSFKANVRPERIGFADAGLAGTVKARIFQGHHWLVQVATEAGLMTVIAPNDGRAVPAEGAATHLTWRAEDMTLSAERAA